MKNLFYRLLHVSMLLLMLPVCAFASLAMNKDMVRVSTAHGDETVAVADDAEPAIPADVLHRAKEWRERRGRKVPAPTSAIIVEVGEGTPYADLNAAMEAEEVTDGVILRIKEGTVMTTEQTIYKSVIVDGPGWELDSNGIKDGAVRMRCYVNLMAPNITLSGLCFESNDYVKLIKVMDDDIVITNCWINNPIRVPNSNYEVVRLEVKNCFIRDEIDGCSNSCNKGWYIHNNIIANHTYRSYYGDVTFETNVIKNLYAAKIDHNVIQSKVEELGNCLKDISYSTITNNIIYHYKNSTTFDGNNIWDATVLDNKGNNIHHNILSCTSPNDDNYGGVTSPKDIFNVQFNFYDFNEKSFRLSSNSVAKGYATDGSDCGAFGGDTPYTGGVGYAYSGLEPTSTVSPLYQVNELDANQPEGNYNGASHYQTLYSLFSAISAFDYNSLHNYTTSDFAYVSVAKDSYPYEITNETYATLKSVLKKRSNLVSDGGTRFIAIYAVSQADFAFTTSSSLNAVIPDVRIRVKELMELFTLENIHVTFNGEPLFEEPFQLYEADLNGLKSIYDALGGDAWTKNKWSFANNGTKKEDFPGVEFKDGRVVSINLNNCNLRGQLPALAVKQLDACEAIYMRGNAIEGDVSPFLAHLDNLTTFDVAYNRLTMASQALPSHIINPSLGCQMRVENPLMTYGEFVSDFWSLPVIDIPIMDGKEVEVELPTFFTIIPGAYYDIMSSSGNYVAYLKGPNASGLYSFTLTNVGRSFAFNDDDLFYLEVQGSDACKGSAWPVHLVSQVLPGDADLSGVVDILDAQWTLRYILAPEETTPFSFDNANTYRSDNIINVQDIVCTVNIILEQPVEMHPYDPYYYVKAAIEREKSELASTSEREQARQQVKAASAWLTSYGDRVVLSASDEPIAAIDMLLTGVRPDEVSLALPATDFMMTTRGTAEGTRIVILSPSGRNIVEAGDEVPVLLTSSQCCPQSVIAASPMAKAVLTGINTASGVHSIDNRKQTMGDALIFNLAGQRMKQLRKGINIVNGKKVKK